MTPKKRVRKPKKPTDISYYKRNGKPYKEEKGRPLAVLRWAQDMEDWNKKNVKQTKLWWGGRVSTVWLGLDHGFGDPYEWNGRKWVMSKTYKPLIFESMVFGYKRVSPKIAVDDLLGHPDMPEFEYYADLDQYRYTSEEEALEGHKALVWKYSINLYLIAKHMIDQIQYHFAKKNEKTE